MYHELSIKAMDVAILKAKHIIQRLYPGCSSDEAWKEYRISEFSGCNEELRASTPWIRDILSDIETLSSNYMNSTMPLQTQIDQLMGDIDRSPFGSDALETAIHFIKKSSALVPESISCSQISGCQEMARKIVLQLKLFEWEVLGLGDSTAGMFLAYHYAALGPYFGNVKGHDWPNIPLNNNPSSLENMFNEQLSKG